MSAIIARRCFVSGRVQGVFYRGSARHKAMELGVHGYAHNLPDGRVEVLAVGDPAAIQTFTDWLWRGPPAAQVTNVEVQDVPVESLPQAPTGFTTR